MIYENLNKLQDHQSLLKGYFWCPKYKREELKQSLDKLHQMSNFNGVVVKKIRTNETRPTCFKPNEFMYPFQEIVNTYGVPRYKEVNPAYFTTISFPFLFGLMYGDIGHGFCIFLGALYIIMYSSRLPKSLNLLVKVRYLVLLMGIFATYCGLIYNDFLGVMTNFNQTCWDENLKRKAGCVPSYGMDRVWGKTDQKIAFMNSFKMKLSIIVAVTHMSVGILMRGVNNLYFGDWVGLVFEFLPQITFFMCTFGYMCVCIVVKWLSNWSNRQPPNIITLFINLVSSVRELIF